MTQEEKELLLKDLSARLPYGVKLEHYGPESRRRITCTLLGVDFFVNEALRKCESPILFDMKGNPFRCPVSYIRPYLRPMSSMTEDELETYDTLSFEWPPTKLVDWFNEHHFDYRGLIKEGLALEAPKDMY